MSITAQGPTQFLDNMLQALDAMDTMSRTLDTMSCQEITRYYNDNFGKKTGNTYSIVLSSFYSRFGCCTGNKETRRLQILGATRLEIQETKRLLEHLEAPELEASRKALSTKELLEHLEATSLKIQGLLKAS